MTIVTSDRRPQAAASRARAGLAMTIVIAKSTHRRLPGHRRVGDSAHRRSKMTAHENINLCMVDTARFKIVIADIVILDIALTISRGVARPAPVMRHACVVAAVALLAIVGCSGVSARSPSIHAK